MTVQLIDTPTSCSPDPYTPYKVYVRAIVNKVETGDSVHITAVTDVAPPSEPTITNATCNPSGGGVIGGPIAAVYVQVKSILN